MLIKFLKRHTYFKKQNFKFLNIHLKVLLLYTLFKISLKRLHKNFTILYYDCSYKCINLFIITFGKTVYQSTVKKLKRFIKFQYSYI